MSFANPWGLLGLLSLPAIAAIHFYHRRFPPLLVGGVHLWGVEAEVRSAGRRRDRLPITATLLLELLAALLLTLVLSQPRFGSLTGVPHLVVVLDNSASMAATPPAGDSFRDEAVKLIEKRVNDLDRGAVVTLIVSGRRPVVLAGPAARWDEAEPALEQWRPAAPRHDFHPAWDLGAQLAADSGELLFLTDRVPDENAGYPKTMEIVSVGERLENVAITDARWTFDSTENEGRVFLRISNRGRKDVTTTVTGRAKQATIFKKSLRIPAGAAVPLETAVDGGLGRLTVVTETQNDGLEIDDRVTLVEPKTRQLHVALTLSSDDAAYRHVKDVLDLIPDLEIDEADSSHLIVGPAKPLPPSRSDLWWLGIGPLDRSEAAREKAITFRDTTPYVLEKRNPLLEGIVLGGIFWGGVQETDLDLAPLIRYEDYPLFARLNGTRSRAYVLNIDFALSNLQRSPDWPILMSNLLETRRDSLPGLRRWNYRLNEDIRFRLFEGDEEPDEASERALTLVHGEHERPIARTALVELPPVDETGIYAVRDGEDLVGEFAVNYFDEEESTLTGLRSGVHDPDERGFLAGLIVDNPYNWAIMIGLVLILAAIVVDWIVLRPKAIR